MWREEGQVHLSAAIDVVAKEEVRVSRGSSAELKQAKNVVILAMYVSCSAGENRNGDEGRKGGRGRAQGRPPTADFDGCGQTQKHRLVHKCFSRSHA